MDLTVIALLRNGDANVDTTMARFRRELQRLEVRWELILLDDGTSGERLQRVQAYVRSDPRIRLMRSPQHLVGARLRDGFQMARGENIVTLEFDAEYSPDQISHLLEALRTQGADIALASCHHPEGRVEGYPFCRRGLKLLRNKLLGLVLWERVYTSANAFRGYRKESLDQLQLNSSGEEIHLEILTQALGRGLHVIETPAVQRFLGATPSWRGWRQSLRYMRFALRERPAILYGVFGWLVALVGLSGVTHSGVSVWVRDPIVTPNILPAFGCVALVGVQILLLGYLVDQ